MQTATADRPNATPQRNATARHVPAANVFGSWLVSRYDDANYSCRPAVGSDKIRTCTSLATWVRG